jgi:hypothetical protein
MGAWPDATALSRRDDGRAERPKARGEKVYTGAYMISAPSTKGADKQAYIAETVIGALWRRREIFRTSPARRRCSARTN